MIDQNITFKVIDDFGKTKKYEILARFSKNEKNYLIYQEENNDEDIYSSLYEIIDNKIKIIPITDDKDYDIVDNFLESL